MVARPGEAGHYDLVEGRFGHFRFSGAGERAEITARLISMLEARRGSPPSTPTQPVTPRMPEATAGLAPAGILVVGGESGHGTPSVAHATALGPDVVGLARGDRERAADSTHIFVGRVLAVATGLSTPRAVDPAIPGTAWCESQIVYIVEVKESIRGGASGVVMVVQGHGPTWMIAAQHAELAVGELAVFMTQQRGLQSSFTVVDGEAGYARIRSPDERPVVLAHFREVASSSRPATPSEGGG